MKTGYLQLHCHSPLASFAADYVEQKRALGLRCRSEVEMLNLFDDFCVSNGLSEVALPQDLFDLWCQKRPHESSSTQNARIGQIKRFAKFLINNGVTAPTVFLPLPKRDKSFLPYIFTHDEIARFLKAVDQANSSPRSGIQSLSHLILPVLFRMLYCCGMRIDEALKLKTKAVDLKSGILRLTDTKGRRERLVPMSASLLQICLQYQNNSAVRAWNSEYFFPAPDGTHYAACTIYERFREYLFAAGIGHGGRGKGPRLHDLRHTFSVHTLSNWVSQGKDIYVALPVLMTYLGHCCLKSTEQYLRLVPESYSQITAPFEAQFGDVFPEVCDENE